MISTRKNRFSLIARDFPAGSAAYLLLLTTILFVQACSFPGVYKINVQQGIIVEQVDLDKLKPGMTKRQVHFVLGTPSLTNTFNSNNEVYIYTFQKAGGKIHQQTVTTYYNESGELSHYTADLLDNTPAY
ncbi:MAG: cell envelope protein SmpA [Gammaproteobacteria bacterium]|nr:MAG: cell envelope protein SmpA [Gammaproteobacteria bacterium]